MARESMVVAKRAAEAGLRAHVLYTTAVQVRDAAESLRVVGDDDAADTLFRIAGSLNQRRKREMRKQGA